MSDEPTGAEIDVNVGDVIYSRHNRYVLVAMEGYTRKTDGQVTTLLRWQSNCHTCGELFEFVTPVKFKDFNRRCEKHKQPGIKTRKRKT